MQKRTPSSLARPALVILLLSAVVAAPVHAGSTQEIIDITGFEPSPVPGDVLADVVRIVRDSRCLPLDFRINDTLDPIPNPLGPDFLTVDEVRAAFETAAERWNEIPTSFFEHRFVGTVSNPGVRRFDQINEITFRTFGAFPPVPSVAYAADSETPIALVLPVRTLVDFFFPDGADLDGDGDPDVSAAIATCEDLDGDGDIEYPEGDYPAGTVLDVDVILNTGETADGSLIDGYRYTVDDADLDTEIRSVDLTALAVQLLGIAQGLAHSPTSQASDGDGTSATLYPNLDTSDPASQIAARFIDADAAATAALAYPEGSGTGIAALQPGDVAPDQVYGYITGEVIHGGRDEPLLGANVFAVDVTTGRRVATALSGQARMSVTPDGVNATFLDASFHALSGRYVLPVPPGQYIVGIEPVDGEPARATSFNLQTILGEILGQEAFHEEYYDGVGEGADERHPSARVVIPVQAGDTVSGIDFVTNRTWSVGDSGGFATAGFDDAAPGTWYAVRFPAAEVVAAAGDVGDGALILGAGVFTDTADDSVVPRFARAVLTTGTVAPDGTATLDLDDPLVERSPFVGQGFDLTPIWFQQARGVTREVVNGAASGEIEDLFLAVQVPAGPFPGVSGAAPRIGLDAGPGTGRSYVSADGASFEAFEEANFLFELILARVP